MIQNLATGILNLMLYPACYVWAVSVRTMPDPMQDPAVKAYFERLARLDDLHNLG